MSYKCVFCGRPSSKARFMVKGPNGKNLCNDCVSIISIVANQALLEMDDIEIDGEPWDMDENKKCKRKPAETEDYPFEEKDYFEALEPEIMEDSIILTPKEITDVLDRHVIGQDKAKKTLAVAIYNHAKRIRDTTGRIKKSNILMIGPSGSGKTLLAKTLAQVLDVPFAIADATSLTEAGYVGDDVENILTRLIDAANGDIEKAQRGIIYIDEIDKISRKSESPSLTRDVSGEGVQHALLKIIEGADISVPVNGGRKHPRGGNVMINTDNILFICGGAFEGLKTVEKENKKTIGFGSTDPMVTDKEKGRDDELLPDILVRYGMTPELMGRLPVIVSLDELKEEDLVHILTEPEFSLTKEYQELLAMDGIKLEFEDEALREIAKVALERNVGARGLRSIMEDLMLDIMYTAPGKNKKRCIITKDTVYTKKPKYMAA